MRPARALLIAAALLSFLAARAAESQTPPNPPGWRGLKALFPPPAEPWKAPRTATPGTPASGRAAAPTTSAPESETAPAGRGVQAVLVRNPSPKDGAPPYGLADQHGVMQRLVEPTPGVDLSRYVGYIVEVKHDTGGTLLASQLLLPADLDKLVGPIDSTPRLPPGGVVAAAFQAEPLPDPIVLEEVIGEPVGGAPATLGLQFPSTVLPTEAGPAPTPVATPCVSCGSVIGGGCPRCSAGSGLFGGFGVGGLGLGGGGVGNWLATHSLDASIEALWLQAHDSQGVNGGNRFSTGSRFELGLNGHQGYRIAARYFEYNTTLTAGPLNVETLDLELQRRFPLGGRGQWGLGGGVRWAEYSEAGGQNYTDTIGPLIGAYARFPAFGRVDGIAHLRQSFQFGDNSAGQNGTFGVTEFQAGLERRRNRGIGQTVLRGFFEAQNWTGAGGPAGSSADRGLVGVGVGIGLVR
ncbi:MAG: hypothetical protein AAGB00_03805 [Planctomycetota bacterium]